VDQDNVARKILRWAVNQTAATSDVHGRAGLGVTTGMKLLDFRSVGSHTVSVVLLLVFLSLALELMLRA
jgi:hypothetical protein